MYLLYLRVSCSDLSYACSDEDRKYFWWLLAYLMSWFSEIGFVQFDPRTRDSEFLAQRWEGKGWGLLLM